VGSLSTLLIILVLGTAGIICWIYRKGKRIIAWLLAIPAFLLAATVAPWRDALATLTSTRNGLLFLVAVFILSGVAFWFEGVRGHMHHHITSAVAGIAFATSAVMVIGHLPRLIRLLSKSPASTGLALARTQFQIASGHAARHMSHDHALKILIGVLIAVAVLMFLARRVRGLQRSVTLPPPSIKPRMLTSGGGSSARKSARGGPSRGAVPGGSGSPGASSAMIPFGGNPR